MATRQARSDAAVRRVSIVALPEAAVSTLYGLYDVFNASRLMGIEAPTRFDVEIVGEVPGRVRLASGIEVDIARSIDAVGSPDIVIVPSLVLPEGGWTPQRHPRLVAWLRQAHAHGALLCSACSGIFVIAETGLYDGRDATVHFAYAGAFATAFPAVPVHPERVLVISGARHELISSGASSTWHDMVLYLIARFADATTAQTVARMFALQWHQDGLAPYMVFEGRADHGDAEIAAAQRWLETHFAVANPVEAMIRRSHLAERTFKRRFVAATGLAPIAYVQRLRIEDAKRRLERSTASVDEISWRVGYEDAAFFRRLFRRVTGLAPGAYRKRFRIPDFARAGVSPRAGA